MLHTQDQTPFMEKVTGQRNFITVVRNSWNPLIIKLLS
jgi:hypothetical protein